MLRGAQKSPVLATVVRESMNITDYVTVGIILGPRIGKTLAVIRETRGQGARFRAMRGRGVAS